MYIIKNEIKKNCERFLVILKINQKNVINEIRNEYRRENLMCQMKLIGKLQRGR